MNRAPGKYVLAALAALAASTVASPLPAQDVGDPLPSVVPVLDISDRVRVSVDGVRIIGEVAGATLEGFEFVQGEIRRSFAFSEIDDLEQSVGMRSLGPWVMLPGFFGGILVKSGIDGCLDNGGDGELDCLDRNEVLLWGGGGALLGAVAGLLIRFEVWESVLPDGDSVALSPTLAPQPGRDGRVALAVRARIGF